MPQAAPVAVAFGQKLSGSRARALSGLLTLHDVEAQMASVH